MPSQTPTSILVMSIIGIVLGVIGALVTAFNVIAGAIHFAPTPLLRELSADDLYVTITLLNNTIGLVLCVLLIAGSIGSLFLAKWARKAILAYALFTAINALGGALFGFTYVAPLAATIASRGRPNLYMPTFIGGIIGGTVALLLSWTLCFLFYYFFTRPKAIDAFNGIFPPTASFPIEPTWPPQSP